MEWTFNEILNVISIYICKVYFALLCTGYGISKIRSLNTTVRNKP